MHFINLTSYDRTSFEKLLNVFKRYYDFSWRSKNVGRPGALKTKHEVLGLILMFYTATIEYKSLCGHFGIPPPTLSRTLRKAEAALLLTLKRIPEALIVWPSMDLQRFWSALVTRKEPLLKKMELLMVRIIVFRNLVMLNYKMHNIMDGYIQL
jgi:hypothetical protein